MKNTINLKARDEKEYEEIVEMLKNREFIQIGTRLFEDNRSFIRITVEA